MYVCVCVCGRGVQVQSLVERRFSEANAYSQWSRKRAQWLCWVWQGWTHPSLIYESDPLNPAELKDTNWEFSHQRARFGCCSVGVCKFAKKWCCVMCVISTWRGWGNGVGMGACLLCGHRTSVLLIGVEGFPHRGFRHFIRYVNIRGVRPEEPGEEEEESSGVKWVKLREWVSPDRQKGRDRKVKFTQFPAPLIMSACLCVSVCMRACVCSPGVLRFLDVSGLAALHGNLNSIFPLLAEHNLWLLKDTQAHKKSVCALFTPVGFTAVWVFHLNYLLYLLGGIVEVFLLPLGH